MFRNGELHKNGDYFLYTYIRTVIQLRYMAELLGVDVSIGGLGMLVVVTPRLWAD